MDNLRPFDTDDAAGTPEHEEFEENPAIEPPPSIGTDERRMHVRAYNYWASLLRDRAYPSIEDLDPEQIDDFGPNSVLLDFTGGIENPVIAWLGPKLREECDLEEDVEDIEDVPSRSLLSRLTDHYMQIIANQAPVGFEAEFVNHRGDNTMYRGILMPFSSDDDTIDFIYGVINWKTAASAAEQEVLQAALGQALATPEKLGASTAPVWADGPSLSGAQTEGEGGRGNRAADETEIDLADDPEPESLADFLSVARESAEFARLANSRSRAALYAALGRAYDFAQTADAEPETYKELLRDAGIRRQDRAPMTPVVKLVFGADYDKTRLTEFASALTYARHKDIGRGALAAYLEKYEGGLKAVVAAERALRRPVSSIAPAEDAGAALRDFTIRSFVTLDEDDGDEEFALLIARRMPDGRFAVLGAVPHDESLQKRAIKVFSRQAKAV